MKQAILLLAAAMLAISCTKGGSSPSGYTCSCTVTWNSGKNDTTYDYPYGAIDQATASSNCDAELKKLQAKYGYGTSTTGGQWVTCGLK